MKTEKRYGIIFGTIVAAMLILFDIINYVFPPPQGLNLGTPLDFILLSPTFIIWRLLNLMPKEPLLADITITLLTTVMVWTIIGYIVGKIISKFKK